MDLNFVEPSEAPVPPDEIRIRKLEVEPFPDQRRLKVRLELTPFQQRPTVVVAIVGSGDEKLAATSIIESIDHVLEFTMHLRGPAGPNELRMQAAVGYDSEAEPIHTKELAFRMTD